jgi:hypothetical protein
LARVQVSLTFLLRHTLSLLVRHALAVHLHRTRRVTSFRRRLQASTPRLGETGT